MACCKPGRPSNAPKQSRVAIPGTAERASLQSGLRKCYPIHKCISCFIRLRDGRRPRVYYARIAQRRKRPVFARKEIPTLIDLPPISNCCNYTVTWSRVLIPVSGRLSSSGSVYEAACRNNFSGIANEESATSGFCNRAVARRKSIAVESVYNDLERLNRTLELFRVIPRELYNNNFNIRTDFGVSYVGTYASLDKRSTACHHA